MAGEVQIRINDTELKAKLRNFVQRIGGRALLVAAGEVMMGSTAQTFRDEGSPAGSWPPLAASTASHVTAGHKLLIGRGRLIRSITYQVEGEDRLVIGSNLSYAAAHQLGFHGSVSVKGFRRRVSSRNVFGSEIVPVTLTSNMGEVVHQFRKRRKKLASGITFVKPFSRMMNLPARPYLVFRPEDPERITKAMERVVDDASQQTGLK